LYKQIIFFVIGICLRSFTLFAQNTVNPGIDSLTKIIQQSPGTIKAAGACVALSELLYISNPDTVLPLCQKAIALINTLFKEKKSLNNTHILQIQAHAFHNMGVIYQDYNKTAKALAYYLQALKIREQIQDKDGIAETLNALGVVYKTQGNFEKALEYYKKSLALRQENKNDRAVALVFGNIANVYTKQGNDSMALSFNKQALKIYEKLNNNRGIGIIEFNLGLIYSDLDSTQKAIEFYHRSLAEKIESSDENGESNVLNAIAKIELEQKNIAVAKKYALQSFDIANKLEFPENTMKAAGLLYEIFKKEQNWKEALKMHETYTKMQDIVFNEENAQQAIRTEMNYEFDKKEVADSLKTVEERKINEVKFKQEKTQRYALYGGLALVLIFAGFMFNRFKITQKQKTIIELKEKETQKQKELIEEQKHLVEEKNQEITDSISYAQRIQQSILPPLEEINTALPNSFILFKPKDIVSGDFYWFHHAEDSILIAAADCTGHGVPGAFMSMLNSDKLNEAVEKSTDVSKILQLVNLGLKKALKQSEKDATSRDGMDIALVSFNKEMRRLEYAGANRPLWIVRNGKNEIEETKATKTAIGGFTDDKQIFTKHSFELKKGDTIYIFSDGYADQFSPNDKKLMTKKFKENIYAIQDKTMIEQKEFLNTFIDSWKGNMEQTDDILVIGVRV
jgi:serine phosphatase RsbU (regulator of sigma subunit)/tetratricopeptide (TPR) repeat protein